MDNKQQRVDEFLGDVADYMASTGCPGQCDCEGGCIYYTALALANPRCARCEEGDLPATPCNRRDCQVPL